MNQQKNQVIQAPTMLQDGSMDDVDQPDNRIDDEGGSYDPDTQKMMGDVAPHVPGVIPITRGKSQQNAIFNDFPTIYNDYQLATCIDCNYFSCYNRQKYQCFKNCQAACERACCTKDNIEYRLKTSQGLVVLFKQDLMGHAVGPGMVTVCCTNDKEFHWINTGIQTLKIPEFNVIDSDLKTMRVGLVLTYRVTDMVNYVFNLKGDIETDGQVEMNSSNWQRELKEAGMKCFMILPNLIMRLLQYIFYRIILGIIGWLCCLEVACCKCCYHKKKKSNKVRLDLMQGYVDDTQARKVQGCAMLHAKAACQSMLATMKITEAVKEEGSKFMINELAQRMKYAGLAIIDVSFVTVNSEPHGYEDVCK